MSQALSLWLTSAASGYADGAALGQAMRELRAAELDRLPLPGAGQTLQRWQALASVGGHDLGLCKLFEGHTDALAIMAELGHPDTPPGSVWGTWASEPPQARVTLRADGERLRLSGRKAWCSGAHVVSHGLLTAWDDQGRQQLVAVAMAQPGVQVTDQGWQAVGMAATRSVEVHFDDAVGEAIGAPGDYTGRPGFWQGGIGVAACWFGAARQLADTLLAHCQARPEPHALAHLGAVDVALHGAACALRQAAEQIDRLPQAPCELLARRTRALIEDCAERVIQHGGRALGAGPYCQNGRFARLIADLPVFLRQSHAERDLAALGQLLHTPQPRTWPL
jgi:hypothetical protein